MAELAAIGLAANILAFLEFSGKTAVKFRAFYARARIGTVLPQDLDTITKDLSECLQKLQDECLENSTTEDTLLLKLAKECQTTAQELQSQLARLKPARKSRLEATQKAWKAIWSENRIVGLQQRLEGFRTQFNLHILTDLR